MNRDEAIEWVDNNSALIFDLYLPLAQHENSLLLNYDDVFRDSIRKNFKEVFFQLLCIQFNRSTGLPAEVFYSVFDDDMMNKLIYVLEDFDLVPRDINEEHI